MNLKKLNLILSCILIFLIVVILSYNIALIYKNNHLSVKVTEYKNVYEFGKLQNTTVHKIDPLFPRLDVALETEYIKGLMQKK